MIIIIIVIIIIKTFLKNLTFQFPQAVFLKLCLNMLRFVVILSCSGTLFRKEGPMKEKAFRPMVILWNICLMFLQKPYSNNGGIAYQSV